MEVTLHLYSKGLFKSDKYHLVIITTSWMNQNSYTSTQSLHFYAHSNSFSQICSQIWYNSTIVPKPKYSLPTKHIVTINWHKISEDNNRPTYCSWMRMAALRGHKAGFYTVLLIWSFLSGQRRRVHEFVRAYKHLNVASMKPTRKTTVSQPDQFLRNDDLSDSFPWNVCES